MEADSLGGGTPPQQSQQQPPDAVLQLWQDVGTNLDKSQTVVWKSAVDSLDAAVQWFAFSQNFLQAHANPMICILLEQHPSKIGPHERSCVGESLQLATQLAVLQLKSINSTAANESTTNAFMIPVLTNIFNKKKAYYKGTKGTLQWNNHHNGNNGNNNAGGLPEVRMKMMHLFRSQGGFQALIKYWKEGLTVHQFLATQLEGLHPILSVLADSLNNNNSNNNNSNKEEWNQQVMAMVDLVVQYVYVECQEDALKKLSTDVLTTIQNDLQRMVDRLGHRQVVTYYTAWRNWIWKLITATSLPVRLFGWSQMEDLLQASADHRPPPACFVVANAGNPVVNGVYEYAGPKTPEGYYQKGGEVVYEYCITADSKPPSLLDSNVIGKKLTLFRCTMRSQQKWWFLSEADEEQPGTDRDIDYYQHKSKQEEEFEPPASGWITCRNAGADPPPTLERQGWVVPAGQETHTLEHELLQWVAEKDIVALVVGDSVHREIVVRAIPLMKCLAKACPRPDMPDVDAVGRAATPEYALQARHLLLAWKSCTKKADAAVAAQLHQLLVSILPVCAPNVAEQVVAAMQASLEKANEVHVVADFLTAWASAAPPAAGVLDASVRKGLLDLCWSLLMMPAAEGYIKSYDLLRTHVHVELSREPQGREWRQNYLHHFLIPRLQAASSSSAASTKTPVTELDGFKIVQWTHFVLLACPRADAVEWVEGEEGRLAVLLFEECIASLKRSTRKIAASSTPSVLRKSPSAATSESSAAATDNNPAAAAGGGEASQLAERMQILRYVYTRSPKVDMSLVQLQSLWDLCESPVEREELMVFMAHAAPEHQDAESYPAFGTQVATTAFVTLFCAPTVRFVALGERAYASFQALFHRLQGRFTTAETGIALDALWRICLSAGDPRVVRQARHDLLGIYMGASSSSSATIAADSMQTDAVVVSAAADEAPADSTATATTTTTNGGFGRRVFACLNQVKAGLEAGEATAEVEAERCLMILNAAIGQNVDEGVSSISLSTLTRLLQLPPMASSRDMNRYIPHGMRGQAQYRRVGVFVKRPQTQSTSLDSKQQQPSRFHLDVHPLETLASIKKKVATYCGCAVASIKPVSISGRLPPKTLGDSTQTPLSASPDDSVVDELGIVQGCELVFAIADRQQVQQTSPVRASAAATRNARSRDLSELFINQTEGFTDRLFETLLEVLDLLPWRDPDAMTDDLLPSVDVHRVAWELLFAIPTNASVESRVRLSASGGDISTVVEDDDAMDVDSRQGNPWSRLLDPNSVSRSVYVLLAVDALLEPAKEVFSSFQADRRTILNRELDEESLAFRRGFIDSGGFDAVVKFLSAPNSNQARTRMGNSVALRILKCCLFGSRQSKVQGQSSSSIIGGNLDDLGSKLLQSLSNSGGLLPSLTAMVIEDSGITTSAVADVLRFLHILLKNKTTAERFVALPNGAAERLLKTLLLWDEDTTDPASKRVVSVAGSSQKIRKAAHDLILVTPVLADNGLSWLIRALETIDVQAEGTEEYFDVLKQLVSGERSTARTREPSPNELASLASVVCNKLSACPRPTSETVLIDFQTGVLCGCLALLRALTETGGGAILQVGTLTLIEKLKVSRWSSSQDVMAIAKASMRSAPLKEDEALVDLMGAIFDAFLSPGGSSSTMAICCDKESRQRGFDVVGAAARSCSGGYGYLALVVKVNRLVAAAAPNLRHKWGQFGGGADSHTRVNRSAAKYSGLKNQGCTCYMNSVLQQLFMMPELRKSMCAAPLPATLRSSGGIVSAKGQELVGKKISLQWENAVNYDAIVEAYDGTTGMHTIRYLPMQVATVGGAPNHHHQVNPEDVANLPPVLPDEFYLSEGRPGKETGSFEIIKAPDASEADGSTANGDDNEVEESEDEANSRHLMEEVQRTFIHLDEGSRGRHFDPRALVEACACLKLEFDVWQQNDASEFATKLLDRLEISLKRWAPDHFRYLDHTFGLKQTKQKICKECGLKTNREEKFLNLDCQIRGKADIHEALGSVTEVEMMEGSNQVFCDRCKKNTDTVLKTAISSLPNMLILSLKRFDLDYNTFETVKLNSRCAFGQTLNMKRYTLEGLEALDQAQQDSASSEGEAMDEGESPEEAALRALPDDDYEYNLAGVLVHAGVAQGGHYYSFIKDRNEGTGENWYRFDDEDVTPFDPAQIEAECFGGKVKKETKWPNGQVHTVESEQYANALMLFYEKVKKTEVPLKTKKDEEEKKDKPKPIPKDLSMSSGFDVFEPDVRRSNATHRWQTFLFDTEFQAFLKGLLGLCRLSPADFARASSSGSTEVVDSNWRAPLVDMLSTFFFDVLLYSSEKLAFSDWALMLEQTLAGYPQCANGLVRKLAMKTQEISSSWMRTYLSDCPDTIPRTAATRIILAAIRASLLDAKERRQLLDWALAWKQQVERIGMPTSPIPFYLEGEYAVLDDLSTKQGSALGVIVSFLNVLLDASTRNWRFYGELGILIRNLTCSIAPDQGGRELDQALMQSLMAARLTCLISRERSHPRLRVAFPAACLGLDAAETQVRAESNPHAVLTALGGPPATAAEANPRGGGSPMDYLPLLEALCCLMGMRFAIPAPLLMVVEDSKGGHRQRVVLTEGCRSALKTIFAESCAPGTVGMGPRQMEDYLARCGLDASAIPTQKIKEIMARYPLPDGSTNALSLEGFLVYYRDTAQTSELRVRNDLHAYGFRPDLSRRSEGSIYLTVNGQKRRRNSVESVALDVSLISNNNNNNPESSPSSIPTLGTPLADLGVQTFALYCTAVGASEGLAEILAAAAIVRKKSSIDVMIVSTLRAVYTAPIGWSGNEIVNAALMVLKILVSVKDEYQAERIDLIFHCSERANSLPQAPGIGVLVAPLHLMESQTTSTTTTSGQHHHAQQYGAADPNRLFERYVNIMKEFIQMESTYTWLRTHHAEWSWMEDHVMERPPEAYAPRGGFAQQQSHPSSDSDMLLAPESEEDDEEDEEDEDADSRDVYGGSNSALDVPTQIVVQGAGLAAVNGPYTRDGYHEQVTKYSRTGVLNGERVVFSIFQCNVSNNTKHWYISVVPQGSRPGTASDIDFYSAPVQADCRDIPPLAGWVKAQDGMDPTPQLIFEHLENSNNVWRGGGSDPHNTDSRGYV